MEAKIGLHTGKAGLLLSKYVCKQISSNELENEIKEIQEHISNSDVDLGVGGVAGFLWLLNYLEREDPEILGFSVSDFTADVDPYMEKHALFMLKQGIYDFFYGSLGIANYFVNSHRTTQRTDFLQRISQTLNYIANLPSKESFFLSRLSLKEDKIGINLGLAHGLPSIVHFCAKAIYKNITVAANQDTIMRIFHFIIDKRLPQNKPNSVFSNWVCLNEKPSSSRLAWCYGDLGIGLALHEAGMVLKNRKIIGFSIELLLKCTLRKELVVNGVVDAGLCHGAAGIGLCFYRIFLRTRRKEFYEAASYWFSETKKMVTFQDGINGYKAWHGKKGYVCDESFLNGYAGIAMALHSWDNQIDPTWDQFIMLS